MKTRESGMPEEGVWAGFFDPPAVLQMLGLTLECRDAVDFGCGYGTFTIPAARIISGKVYALDIEPEMIAATQTKATAASLSNVKTLLRDFVADGSGLPGASVDYVMLFNILHAESPGILLGEAMRVLVPGGKLAIMHWRHDPATPRGPSLNIRPQPEQCCQWAEQVGFRFLETEIIELPPYHYGLSLKRPPLGQEEHDR